MYPAKFPGLGEALIFFCFFSSIKGRKEDHSKAPKPGGFWASPHDMAQNPAGFGLCHTT